MTRLLVLLSLGALGFPPAATAQDPDSVLTGVFSVDARVLIDWDERLTGISERQARQSMESRFTLELRKLGIVIDTAALNFLTCNVNVLFREPNGIVYSLSIALQELLRSTRLDTIIWVDTWKRSVVGFAPATNLQQLFNDLALECAELFGNAWLSANPRR